MTEEKIIEIKLEHAKSKFVEAYKNFDKILNTHIPHPGHITSFFDDDGDCFGIQWNHLSKTDRGCYVTITRYGDHNGVHKK